MEVFEQSQAWLCDFLAEGDNEHYLATVVGAQDECAELTLVGVLVVERQTVFARKGAHTVPDAVVDVRHESASLYVEHFVETVGDVKTESVGVVDVL